MDVAEEAEKLPPFPQIIVLKHCQQQYYIVVEKTFCWRVMGLRGAL